MGLGQCQAQGPALSRGSVAAVSIISSLNLGFVSEVPWDAGHTLGVGAWLMGIYHPQEEISLLPACPPRSHLAPSSRVSPVTAPFLPVVVTAHVHGMGRAQP